MSKTADKTRPASTRQLDVRVRLTLGGLYWQGVWSALWPASGFIGLYLALSLVDAWAFVPDIVQLICLTAAFGISAGLLVRALRRTRWPTRADALRRMESASALLHRPLSELDDDLSEAGSGSQEARALWHRHKERQRAALEAARSAVPKSDLPMRDPHAIRVAIAMALVVSFLWAGRDWPDRLGQAFQPGFSLSSSGSAHITAWVDPPDFTGVAPLFLERRQGAPRTLISVPQKSLLVVRLSGVRGKPSLVLPSDLNKDRDTKSIAGEKKADGSFEIRYTLEAGGTFKLKNRGRRLDEWRFAVTPDAAPFAAFEQDPKATSDNRLEFTYSLHDDYGIGAAALVMTLDGSGAFAGSENRFSVDLPSAPFGAGAGKTSVTEKAVLDLTAHPFAGLNVAGELTVVDLGGQEGRSEVRHFTLPQRDFFDPLALAITEQRRNLARSPADFIHVMNALEALTMAPEYFFDDLTAYIGLRTAYWQLDRVEPTSLSAAMATLELLWDLALHVEDGNVSLAEEELRAIALALQDALARGAPMDEIQRLLERYRQAMERYLAAMAEKAVADAGQTQTPPPGQDGLSVDQQDIQDLLKAIEELARTGDRAAAAQLMAQLQRMMENMTMQAQGGMTGPEADLAGKIEDLSDLIGKERALMDETLRRSQQGGGQQDLTPKSELENELEKEQGELGKALDDIEGGDPSGEAGEAMKDAEDALGQGDARRALHAERRAIDAMRRSAETMAEELQRAMQARGASGTGGQDGALDPLGRTQGKAGRGLGDHIKVPEERDLQRARQILEELKKRASETGRPDIELDYLERLLKRF